MLKCFNTKAINVGAAECGLCQSNEMSVSPTGPIEQKCLAPRQDQSNEMSVSQTGPIKQNDGQQGGTNQTKCLALTTRTTKFSLFNNFPERPEV